MVNFILKGNKFYVPENTDYAVIYSKTFPLLYKEEMLITAENKNFGLIQSYSKDVLSKVTVISKHFGISFLERNSLGSKYVSFHYHNPIPIHLRNSGSDMFFVKNLWIPLLKDQGEAPRYSMSLILNEQVPVVTEYDIKNHSEFVLLVDSIDNVYGVGNESQ